ncbi:MAG: hypothetical protein ISR65_18585 [Bacteriovoracaceae bacterium]|nr:hypothetical protein [Bacteriovoracaceae bacterium]
MFYKYLVLLLVLIIIASSTNTEAHAERKNKLRSWKELKREKVVMQSLDYSCGPSAVITLLKHYFDEKVITEKIFLDKANLIMGPKEIKSAKENGLSMSDLKRVIKSFGYDAIGMKIPFKTLLETNVPVIVYIQDKMTKHFAVYAGYDKGFVRLLDPSRGSIYIAPEVFGKEYLTEKALVIHKNNELPDKLQKGSKDHNPLVKTAFRALKNF